MTHEQILKTEYSSRFDELRYSLYSKQDVDPHFDELRKNMMVLSFYKYGAMKDNYDKHKCMDAIGNIKKRLAKYLETGNTEFLADIANFAMIEYMYPSIPETNKENVNFTIREDTPIEAINGLLTKYKEKRTIVALVQIANLCAQEFTSPSLKNAFYQPTDSGACEVAGFGIKQLQAEMEEKENRSFQRFI